MDFLFWIEPSFKIGSFTIAWYAIFILTGVILAVILGNCLDNSIAACLRLPNKERSLSINIRYFQQNLFINIRNNFDEKEKSTRKSRQKDGWGLRNIDALVQEYQGDIKRFIKDGQYQIEILLPIKIGTIPTKEL